MITISKNNNEIIIIPVQCVQYNYYIIHQKCKEIFYDTTRCIINITYDGINKGFKTTDFTDCCAS